MEEYDLFDESIPEELKYLHEEQMAQREALFKASNIIAEAMKESGINRTDLAKKLGVTRGYIFRILSGHENMTIKNVSRILFLLEKRYIQDTISIVNVDEKSNIINFSDYSTKQSATIETENVRLSENNSDEFHKW